MRDYQIETLLFAQTQAGLTARSISGVAVKQNNQSRQVVAASGPAVYFSSGRRKPYGWPQRQDVPNLTTGKPDRITTQIVHTTFTVAACVPNISPADPAPLTSGDLISLAQEILQHEDAQAAFIAAGCNVLRVTELPAIWFETSNEQMALWASFDIIFTHKDVFTTPGNVISHYSGNVNKVP